MSRGDGGARKGGTLRVAERPALPPVCRTARRGRRGLLGPAHVTAKFVDLGGCRRLLDVGGGTGAFSIALCRRYPDLTATILDFPNVRPVAERYVVEAGLDPDSATLTPGWLSDQVAARGLAVERVQDVIPGITKVLLARRPGG